jgi:hypothetical protein
MRHHETHMSHRRSEWNNGARDLRLAARPYFHRYTADAGFVYWDLQPLASADALDPLVIDVAPAQCRHGDARGLEVSQGGLLQNEFVQRQIGNCLAQPAVLELKVLQALHLLAL